MLLPQPVTPVGTGPVSLDMQAQDHTLSLGEQGSLLTTNKHRKGRHQRHQSLLPAPRNDDTPSQAWTLTRDLSAGHRDCSKGQT